MEPPVNTPVTVHDVAFSTPSDDRGASGSGAALGTSQLQNTTTSPAPVSSPFDAPDTTCEPVIHQDANTSGPLPTPLHLDCALFSMEQGDFKNDPQAAARESIRSTFKTATASLPTYLVARGTLAHKDARVVHLNQPDKNEHFTSNQVITAKYTKLTFLPRFLYSRLSQTANFYFVLVGVGQIIPQISSTKSIPYQWIVLAIVLSIDAVFAAIEDRARHRADDRMNSLVTHEFDANEPSCFKQVMWKDLRVGTILKVQKYEQVPADLVLLAVAEANPDEPVGICFAETKSLDGETNLKIRQALSCTFSQLSDPRSLGELPGIVVCEQPNHDVNNFTGRYEPQPDQPIPFDLKNVVLRGSVIRNSSFVYGLVLNTGKDTKIMQSMSETPQKQSHIMTLVNRGIVVLMTLLILFCIVGSALCACWVGVYNDRALYLMLHDTHGATPFPLSFMGWTTYMGYYWILISSFVPITLYVTIAVVKAYQTRFIMLDLKLYDESTDTPALVRNSDLNEELGQITHVFCDKTGTLTANEMDFRKMSIHGESYGRGTTEIGREAVRRLGKEISASDVLADQTTCDVEAPNVHFLDPTNKFLRHADHKECPEQAQHIEEFFLHLAVCHTVVLEHDPTANECEKSSPGAPTFSASSPDELALVSGASYFGFTFANRKNGSVTIRTRDGVEQVFEMLEMVDFTSTRKRMSVVVRDATGRILLLTKGADAVLFERMEKTPETRQLIECTNQHLEQYAMEGLRTLVIARKEIPEEEFLSWAKEYKAVVSDLDQVAKYKAGEPNRIEQLEDQLERNLQLLGATAIEDRLQDQVPSTIADLARAGVKLWILTGDKEETAINIGFACQLLSNAMDRLVINLEHYWSFASLYDLLMTKAKAFRQLRKTKSRPGDNTIVQAKQSMAWTAPQRQQALIIDGSCLTMVLENPVLKELFLEVSQYCCSVICCRVTPKQKAQVVRLYKTKIQGCRCLAIGDGANDVGMIQEAHVGVGISGHEGMQAVNASDYAIAQFRFLRRLLFVHGHWNYRRMAKLVLYVVYKNILLYTACYMLGLLPGGSGTLYYNNLWIKGYNTFWTCLPVSIVAIFEQDVTDELAETHSGLYATGMNSDLFSLRILLQWIGQALYEGFVCALVPVWFFGLVDSKCNSSSLQVCGAVSYCIVITVSWLKLLLNTVSFNLLHLLTMAFSTVFWFGSALLISTYFPASVADVAFPYVLTLPEFYLLLYLGVLLCLMRDFLFKAYKRQMRPEYYHVLQELHKKPPDKFDAQTQWLPPSPSRHLKPFEADLCHKPCTKAQMKAKTGDKTKKQPSKVIAAPSTAETVSTSRRYTGFAFSTQVLEDRFTTVNPMHELSLPTTELVEILDGARVGDTSQHETSFANWSSRSLTVFEEVIRARELEQQVVYEIQRYQIFIGWGSTHPGHLLPHDPPPFTNAEMTYGTSKFDLSDFVLDICGGDDRDGWEYAVKFKDFLRDNSVDSSNGAKRRHRSTTTSIPPTSGTNTTGATTVGATGSNTSNKTKLNRLVGRCVRRRRWIRKEIGALK